MSLKLSGARRGAQHCPLVGSVEWPNDLKMQCHKQNSPQCGRVCVCMCVCASPSSQVKVKLQPILDACFHIHVLACACTICSYMKKASPSVSLCLHLVHWLPLLQFSSLTGERESDDKISHPSHAPRWAPICIITSHTAGLRRGVRSGSG